MCFKNGPYETPFEAPSESGKSPEVTISKAVSKLSVSKLGKQNGF